MKKTLIGLAIASVLTANAHAETMSFEASTTLIMTRMAELAELAKDPSNVVIEGDKKYLSYRGKKLRINYDGNVKFDLFDFDSEFDTVFEFIPTEWEKYWYDGGFDIYPMGFFTAEKCTFGMYPAARGSKDNQGNYIWNVPKQVFSTRASVQI
ncbi:hypothetical protein [Enterovibrio coralii]|uniref:hypothetical protein n=1 Tax=Enterovibrio coralii TaxID=294935 RepID=UPI000B057B5A|nr:hypothetical protein [Enterovibrio coralii]